MYCVTGEQEAWWTKENHYPTEMTFIPTPQALEEDEGVLLTIAYDGVRYKHEASWIRQTLTRIATGSG